jgi:hypothetical protein
MRRELSSLRKGTNVDRRGLVTDFDEDSLLIY